MPKKRSGHYIGRKSCRYSALAQGQKTAQTGIFLNTKIQTAAVSGLCLDFFVYFETLFCQFSGYIDMLT